jgi:hypothetical protein
MIYALLLASALIGANDQTQAQERKAVRSHHIDGAWQVVYMAVAGKPLTLTNVSTSVTIKDNTVRFAADALKQSATETVRPGAEAVRQDNDTARPGTGVGMQQSWRLEFGPAQTVRAIPVAGINDVSRRPQAGIANPDPKDQPTTRTRRHREDKRGQVQGEEQTAQSGVYILSGEYLCLSIRVSGSHASTSATEANRIELPARDSGQSVKPTREAGARHQATGPSAGSSFVVILHRSQPEKQAKINR